MSLREFPPITRLVDAGIQKEVEAELAEWNERRADRYPLSPSTIGRCALKLARDVGHFHGKVTHLRTLDSRPPRLQRVFARGTALEDALVGDIEKYTSLKLKQRQQRVHLFNVMHGKIVRPIEGDVDGLIVCKDSGVKILTDFKSKGAYYSSGFNDSISEFFGKLLETGLVEDLGDNCYHVGDIKNLFDTLPLDDFFSDYILQLNSYAFSDWFRRIGVDGVALYYENKNTCAHYEIRWVPDERLFEFAKNKFQYIFSTVMSDGPEAVEREFPAGSAKCRLCEYNTQCNGVYEPKTAKVYGQVDPALTEDWMKVVAMKAKGDRVEQDILMAMEKAGLTHIRVGATTYEKKFLKSPKPHFELRLCRNEGK